MLPTQATRSTRSAFTLIELLVVISIIALLISILLPALRAARESGRAIACASNQRQVVIGFHHYADDHRDALVYTVYRWPGMGANEFWTHALRQYVGVTLPPHGTVKPRGVYECPTSQRFSDGSSHANFGKNARLSPSWISTGTQEAVKHRYSQKAPSGTYMLADTGHLQTPPHSSERGLTPRFLDPAEPEAAYIHQGRLNLTFLDGHVQRVSGDDVVHTGNGVGNIIQIRSNPPWDTSGN
jgi:prepilin-type N-terminal cleavage/methylation domain-containing protein/prepilin-type processing-associated H-X9-DG protein